jgi:hypothetical protein
MSSCPAASLAMTFTQCVMFASSSVRRPSNVVAFFGFQTVPTSAVDLQLTVGVRWIGARLIQHASGHRRLDEDVSVHAVPDDLDAPDAGDQAPDLWWLGAIARRDGGCRRDAANGRRRLPCLRNWGGRPQDRGDEQCGHRPQSNRPPCPRCHRNNLLDGPRRGSPCLGLDERLTAFD